ncbi:hypothetical protein KUCAC02_005252, partial [Chaenocephalus aceratus]
SRCWNAPSALWCASPRLFSAQEHRHVGGISPAAFLSSTICRPGVSWLALAVRPLSSQRQMLGPGSDIHSAIMRAPGAKESPWVLVWEAGSEREIRGDGSSGRGGDSVITPEPRAVGITSTLMLHQEVPAGARKEMGRKIEEKSSDWICDIMGCEIRHKENMEHGNREQRRTRGNAVGGAGTRTRRGGRGVTAALNQHSRDVQVWKQSNCDKWCFSSLAAGAAARADSASVVSSQKPGPDEALGIQVPTETTQQRVHISQGLTWTRCKSQLLELSVVITMLHISRALSTPPSVTHRSLLSLITAVTACQVPAAFSHISAPTISLTH